MYKAWEVLPESCPCQPYIPVKFQGKYIFKGQSKLDRATPICLLLFEPFASASSRIMDQGPTFKWKLYRRTSALHPILEDEVKWVW